MLTEISASFYRITLPMPFRLKHVHVYALVHDGAVSLFDAGYNSAAGLAALTDCLAEIGPGLGAVRDIYITHGHVDHAGLAGIIREKVPAAAVHVPELTRRNNSIYREPEVFRALLKKYYLPHGLAEREVEDYYRVVQSLRRSQTALTTAGCLRDGEVREFGPRRCEVIGTPGHIRDHVCFFFRPEGLLLAGDTVLGATLPSLGPDLLDDSYRPLRSFLDSLARLESLKAAKIYAGHGEPVADPAARLREMRAQLESRKEQVLACVQDEPQTAARIAAEMAGRAATLYDRFGAVSETYAYLQELRHGGLIDARQTEGVVLYTRR